MISTWRVSVEKGVGGDFDLEVPDSFRAYKQRLFYAMLEMTHRMRVGCKSE
jgi:hypothetical protein